MPDKILLFSVAGLTIIGFIALMNASFIESQNDFGNIYGYFIRQLSFGFLGGVLLGTFFYKFPYKKLKKLAVPFLLVSIFLMLLVFIPSMSAANGSAQRWIDLGVATFQPSELLKLSFIIYLAAWFESHRREVASTATLWPFLVFLSIIAGLLALQPNISTLGVIVIIAVSMYFVAGVSVKYALGVVGASIAGLFALIQIAPYRLNRIITFLDPSGDPLGIGYQVNQALIAIGSGSITGTGIAQGVQKTNFLPEPMSDSIFAVWAEATGFIGAFVLVILFVLLMWAGFRIATRSNDFFIKLTATGITVWIFLQAFINMGAMLGLAPLTGITLPLISYGSSSMVVTYAALGLLMQLSKNKKSS